MSDFPIHGTAGGRRTFTHQSEMPVPHSALADWHFRSGALDRLLPPWQDVRVIEDSGPLRAGAETVLSVPLAPGIRKRWHARIEEAIPGERFVDAQVTGPFAAWRHQHSFLEGADAGSSCLRDAIEYRIPFGPLGALGAGYIRKDLEKLIASTVDVNTADYAVITGVQIHNWGSEFDDADPNMEFVCPVSTYAVVNGQRTDFSAASRRV